MASYCLLLFAVRGHRPPVHPLRATPEMVALHARMRHRPLPHHRFLNEELRNLAKAVALQVCKSHGAKCGNLVISETCMLLLIMRDGWHLNPYGMCDAMRLLSTRKARRQYLIPPQEALFAKRAQCKWIDNQQETDAIQNQLHLFTHY